MYCIRCEAVCRCGQSSAAASTMRGGGARACGVSHATSSPPACAANSTSESSLYDRLQHQRALDVAVWEVEAEAGRVHAPEQRRGRGGGAGQAAHGLQVPAAVEAHLAGAQSGRDAVHAGALRRVRVADARHHLRHLHAACTFMDVLPGDHFITF